MGLLERDYMKSGHPYDSGCMCDACVNEYNRRRSLAKPKTSSPKISGHDKKAAIDAFMKGTPIPPPKPSFWQRLFGTKK